MHFFARAALVSALSACSIGIANASGNFYIGAGLHSSSVNGDFGGEQIFTSSADAIVVPKIDSGSGFNLFGGLHMTERWDLEMSYYSSNHSSDWLGVSLDVEYSSLNFDAKINIAIDSEKLTPYILVGYGFGTITVIDGSSDGFGLGDATYYGSGLNFGFGANYYVQPNFSIGAALIKRMTTYDEAEGMLTPRSDLPSELNGDTTAIAINLTYHANQ